MLMRKLPTCSASFDYPRNSRPRVFPILFFGLCILKGSARKDYAVFISAGLRDFKAKVYGWKALSFKPENLPPRLVKPERLGIDGSASGSFKCEMRDALCRVQPSFSDRDGNVRTDSTAGWRDSFAKLLDWCKRKLFAEGLTEEGLRSIPLFVGCSAALTSLPKSVRKSLIDGVKDFFAGNQTISPFLRNPNFVFLLSGKEEAVYAWLASNNLLGTIGASRSYGIITLGKDYTAVAFKSGPDDHLLTSVAEVKLTNLARHWKTMKGNPSWPGTLRFYAHAYMYLGRITFIERLSAKIAEVYGPGGGDSDGYVKQPCMPSGSKQAWDKIRFTRFLRKEFREPQGLVGSSNFDECYATIREILNFDKSYGPCFLGEWPYKDCGLDYDYRPVIPSKQRFLALRGFNPIGRLLTPVLTKSGIYPPFNMSDLLEGSKIICKMDYDQLKASKKENNVAISDGDLVNACAFSTFSYSFLVHGFGFDPSSRQLMFLTNVPKHAITVGDGLILKHVNQLPWKVNQEKETDAQKEMAIPSLLMGFTGTIFGYSLIVMVRYFCRCIYRDI